MSPLASWALIGALTFLSFYAAHHLGAGVDWVLDHMGWTDKEPARPIGVWLVEGPMGTEWYIRLPEGHVRCPVCAYFLPEDATDPITGVCDQCSDSEDADFDAEWRDLQRALEDERREGEDHR